MRTSFAILAYSIVLLSASSASFAARVEEVPCAILIKADAGFQITSSKDSMITQFSGDEKPLACGSIISTHSGTAWIKTKSQVTIKFGPNTYFEFNKGDSEADYFTLSRGRMLMQGAPQKKPTVIYTAQAQVRFTGGVAWVEHHADLKVTQVASFNKTVAIHNRYNEEAFQVVRAGEMSGLDFSDPRVIPKQPKIMNSATANELLSYLGLKVEERSGLVEIVDRVFEDRTKSLASELESWKDIAKPQEDGRSLASDTKKDLKPSNRESIETIQEREAAFVLEQFKKRVFVEAQAPAPQKVEASARAPSSIKKKHSAIEKIEDSEFRSEKLKFDAEKKRVLKEISDSEE